MRLLYAQKAGIERDLCEKVCRYYEKHDAKINKTAEKFYLGNDLCLNNKSDLFRLACVLKAFEYTHNDYVKNRISDDVFLTQFPTLAYGVKKTQTKACQIFGG